LLLPCDARGPASEGTADRGLRRDLRGPLPGLLPQLPRLRGARGRHRRGGYRLRSQNPVSLASSGTAEQLAAPDHDPDGEEHSCQRCDTDGQVDQRQAAGEHARHEQRYGGEHDSEDGAEPDHGHNQSARPVRSRTRRPPIELGQAELGRVRLSTCLAVV
jgi:hypothetical protein